MRWIRVWGAVVLSLGACTGSVSQEDLDEARAAQRAAEQELAIYQADASELERARLLIAAYEEALDPVDVEALAGIYATGLAVDDIARGFSYESVGTALVEFDLAIDNFGLQSQRIVTKVVDEDRAVLEWVMAGVLPGSGEEWELRGVSVIEFRDGLVGSETLYYDLAEAPWS